MKKILIFLLSAGTAFGQTFTKVDNLPAASVSASGDVITLYHNTGSGFTVQQLSIPALQASPGWTHTSDFGAISNIVVSNNIEYNNFPALQWGYDANEFPSDTNGQVIPTVWPDITGNYFATETIGPGGATYQASTLNGNGAVHFSGGQVFLSAVLPPASALTNYTIALVAQDTLEDGANRNVLEFSPGNNGQNGNFYVNTFQAENGGSGPANNAAGGTWNVGVTNSQPGQPQTMGGHTPGILIVRFSAASVSTVNAKGWMNGKVCFDTSVTAGGVGGSNIPLPGGDGVIGNLYMGGGPNTGQNLWTGNFFLALGFATNFTDGQVAALNDLLEKRFGKKGPDVTIVGASNADGAGSIMNSNLTELLHVYLPGYNINGMGFGGIGTGAAYTNYLGSANDNTRDGNPHVVVIMPDLILNDTWWLSGSVTLNQSEAFITNICYQARLRGCLPVVATSPSEFIIETNTASTRANFNSFIYSNWKTFANGMADFASDVLVGTNGSYSNAVVYTCQDGAHIGSLGLQSMTVNELIPAIQYALQGGGNQSISNLTTMTVTANGTFNFPSNNLETIMMMNSRAFLIVGTNQFSNIGGLPGQGDIFLGTGQGLGGVPGGIQGSDDIGIGYNAMGSFPSGNHNGAIGGASGQSLTSGTQNYLYGFGAGALITTGSGNTANGFQSLDSITIDNNNTADGWEALHLAAAGGNNSALGANAGVNLVTGHDNVYINNNGVTTESQVMKFGTANVQTNCYIPMPVTCGGIASTNYAIFGTSLAFNFGTHGVTNLTGMDMRIFSFTAVNAWVSNIDNGVAIQMSPNNGGNVHADFMILAPREAIIGGTCAEAGDASF